MSPCICLLNVKNCTNWLTDLVIVWHINDFYMSKTADSSTTFQIYRLIDGVSGSAEKLLVKEDVCRPHQEDNSTSKKKQMNRLIGLSAVPINSVSTCQPWRMTRTSHLPAPKESRVCRTPKCSLASSQWPDRQLGLCGRGAGNTRQQRQLAISIK